MYSKFATYDRARAQDLLENHNGHNRPISPVRVRTYADLMLAGEWKPNPHGVSFGSDGHLQNGQHTLSALVAVTEVQPDFTLELYTHFDCPVEAFRTYDQGLSRTAAQMYAAETRSRGAGRFTSCARAVMELGFERRRPSHAAVVEWAQAHHDLIEDYAEVGKQFSAGTHAAFVFAHLQGFRHVGEAAARLANMKWYGDGDPMRALAVEIKKLGTKDGAKGKQIKFATTMEALLAVSEDKELERVKRKETISPKVRESIRPELAA
jgi:hypothetical protein